MAQTLSYKNKKKRKGLVAEINVVPYIDVMLVLLVIFMITTPLLNQGVNVNLPQASAKSLSQQDSTPIIVSVDQNGQYFLNIAKQPTQAVNATDMMSQVSAALQAAQQKQQTREVYVKGDNAVDYGKVVQAMVLLQQAGVQNVGLMTEPQNSSP